MQIYDMDFTIFILLCVIASLEYIFIFGGMYYFLYYKPRRLNLKPNSKIRRDDYMTKTHYDFDRKTDVVPEWNSKITVLILRENKFAKILYLSGDSTSFTFEKCLYFVCTPHSCENGAKLLAYLEGISLPVSYENVDKQIVKRTYKNLDGKIEEKEITVIKGLKWDGKILHLFTNRKFAEIFTKVEPDISHFLIIIIGIATLIASCIGIGVTYWLQNNGGI